MTPMIIFIYSIVVLISWFILYYVIKAAVRNGIKEAWSDNNGSAFSGVEQREKNANFAQTRLQQQYNNGEISFEEFKSQWDKLNK
jgi:uncharacterized membrane protein